jgi:hypothetical protein
MQKNRMPKTLRTAIFVICLGLSPALPHTGAAQSDSDSRWLTPTMINARANMFNPELNFLIFQYLDQMFATRSVPAGGNIWKLPCTPMSIEGEFKGSFYGLHDFLEKSATNALR